MVGLVFLEEAFGFVVESWKGCEDWRFGSFPTEF